MGVSREVSLRKIHPVYGVRTPRLNKVEKRNWAPASSAPSCFLTVDTIWPSTLCSSRPFPLWLTNHTLQPWAKQTPPSLSCFRPVFCHSNKKTDKVSILYLQVPRMWVWRIGGRVSPIEFCLFSNVPVRELSHWLTKQSPCYPWGDSDALVLSFSYHEGFAILHYSFVFVCVCVLWKDTRRLWCICGGQRATCRS